MSGGVKEALQSVLAPTAAPVIAIPPPPLTHAMELDHLRDWLDPYVHDVETILGQKSQDYHLVVSRPGTPPILVITIKTNDPLIEEIRKSAERLLRERWLQSDIPVKKTETILKVLEIPASSPYTTIRFSSNEIRISDEAQRRLERYVQFWNGSPSLHPILIEPKSASNQWFAQRRRRAVLAELE